MTVLEKRKPSTDLIEMIKVAGDSLLSFGELWGSIKKKGASEGFSEKELQELLRPYLKEKLDSKKVWYLFHAEEQKDRSKQQYQNRTNISTNVGKKDPEQTPIPTQVPSKIPVVDLVPDLDNDVEPPNEEPTELELANIKIAQLEDALHKTEQFKPATALEAVQQNFEVFEDENVVFDWLRKRDNGINIYYFDNYGRELFANRILSQLKNSGVKTFKRLYFEV